MICSAIVVVSNNRDKYYPHLALFISCKINFCQHSKNHDNNNTGILISFLFSALTPIFTLALVLPYQQHLPFSLVPEALDIVVFG
jgi:hypothetical protein